MGLCSRCSLAWFGLVDVSIQPEADCVMVRLFEASAPWNGWPNQLCCHFLVATVVWMECVLEAEGNQWPGKVQHVWWTSSWNTAFYSRPLCNASCDAIPGDL